MLLIWPAATAAEGKFVITPGHFQHIAAYLVPPRANEAVYTIDVAQAVIDW